MTTGAVSAASSFLGAILWGEHQQVWDLLSPTGREHVLEAGGRHGLDPSQAQRLRLGTSPLEERDSFLTGLVHGLRVDFASVPLGADGRLVLSSSRSSKMLGASTGCIRW